MDITSKETVKRAMMAEAYGMGDIKVGLITGQYPNPSFFPPRPVADKSLWFLNYMMEPRRVSDAYTVTGRVVHRGPETQHFFEGDATDRMRREHKPVEVTFLTDYTEIEKRILAQLGAKNDGNR